MFIGSADDHVCEHHSHASCCHGYGTSVYQTPAYQTPAYQTPAYQTPVYHTPAYVPEEPAALGDDVDLPCQYCDKACKPSKLRAHEMVCPKYYDEYYRETGGTTQQTDPITTR